MEDFLDQIGQLTIQGHVGLARELVEAERMDNPLLYYLGHAMIAAASDDVARLKTFALTAKHYAPDDALVAQALTLMHLHAREGDDAEREAKRAVQLDGSARSWRGLANVYLLTGRPQDAERILRDALSRHEDSEARLALGNVRAQRGDMAGALEQLAKAYADDPTDSRPMQQLIKLYRDAGWMFGVVLVSRVTRGGSHPPEVKVLLDLLALEMLRAIEQSPLKDTVDVADEAARGVIAEAPALPAHAQLRAARTLAETGRGKEALGIVDRLATAALGPREKAEAGYIRGFVKAGAGDAAGALVEYAAAVDAYAEHWEAATNAVSLCLRKGDAAALAEAGRLIARVPLRVRRLNAFMTFNEAAWLAGQKREDEARALLAFLREAPAGPLEGAIGALERSLSARATPN
ncbi:MAG: tetratricopeptide repeat protein [Myxococcota bacterium]